MNVAKRNLSALFFSVSAVTLALAPPTLLGQASTQPALAVVVDADFAKGDFAALGWTAEGAWEIFTYPTDKNNPGPVARYAANKPAGALTKTFDEIKNPKELVLSLDVGWGWGKADHSHHISFMLLDDRGNGYVFVVARAKGKWAAQWAPVTNNKPPKDKKWATEDVDTTHPAILDGGGMQRLTVTRDVNGNWTFAGKGWNQGAGAALKFTDATTTRFTKLVLVGSQNIDELVFNNIVLKAVQGSDFPQNRVSVAAPEYCSEIQGDTTVRVAAPGFKAVTAKCWKQGAGFGADSTVATVALDAEGNGSFVFPGDSYPHGPITIRISGKEGDVQDNCYLQLYNKGGVSWKEGIPKDPPPAAKGMKLVFSDDFTGPLSIGDGPKFTYYDHKPPKGTQDFSTIPFTNHDSPKTPFAQVDTYLRIRASEKLNSAGLISSMGNDGSGIKASAPCYFECRFIAPNAIGTWPAFWLLTTNPDAKDPKSPCDELDIIEGYGGEGPRAPNAGDKYQIVTHFWNQPEVEKAQKGKRVSGSYSMNKAGIPSTWYEAFHTYGCKITETDTIYYCDDIEIARNPTGPTSRKYPFFFLVNLATGGGWPVDLSRYNGVVDMYVDYIRVYQGQ